MSEPRSQDRVESSFPIGPHPTGIDKLHAREAHRSLQDMEQGELTALCAEMGIPIEAGWGADRLRALVVGATYEQP